MKPVFTSREIRIGHLSLGGSQPVRLQSMTNTPTRDTVATVQQVERLVKAGCELVRITAGSMQEAENIKSIRQALLKKRIDIPLIADVHFQPKVAECVARMVEKVRINPGNFSGSHHKNKTYTDAEYQAELKQISQNLAPLLQTCKAQGTALRIGINHGSLSDRILFRYGNTAEGMVAAALEYITVCRDQGFENLTLSLKASHAAIMLDANSLLVKEMRQRGMDFPLHIGVTEAGNGVDGRIKSALGIGTLLAEGIGDTIRVSLTESPENEIPVARILVDFYGRGNILSPVKIKYIPYVQIPDKDLSYVVSFKEGQALSPDDSVLLLSYPEIPFDRLLLLAAVDFNRAYEK
ncbi:MAG TPA: 4-hydroxy-3-methylbut-2-en-1-yl diphosphate synthase, partial [Bacteroidetes bacterium]|nr:4-hydroxy-3-methylbut-2-en-1-yl diphosphate synthase [Bacteroidota bacterium]